MKKTLLIILILVLSAAVAAAQKSTDKQSRSSGNGQQKPAESKPQDSPRAEAQQKEPWPRTFIPSEQIKADTVVSFPADI